MKWVGWTVILLANVFLHLPIVVYWLFVEKLFKEDLDGSGATVTSDQDGTRHPPSGNGGRHLPTGEDPLQKRDGGCQGDVLPDV